MKWSVSQFSDLYASIDAKAISSELFTQLLPDLKELLKYPPKNTESRNKLEKLQDYKTDDGSIFKLNQDFIISIISLSDELNLDELEAVNLVLENSPGSQIYASEVVNNGKISFFLRRQYILQIVSYICNAEDVMSPYYKKFFNAETNTTILSKVLENFDIISKHLSDIKQEVNRNQILDNMNPLITQGIHFKRDFFSKEYDLLSQVLYGLSKRSLINTQISSVDLIIEHSLKMETNDFFVVYFLPTLLNLFSNLNTFSDVDIFGLHKKYTNELITKQEQVYKKPMKVLIMFIFLTFLIGWCKEDPQNRVTKLNFKSDIDDPMTIAVELGAIEQLLIVIADLSRIDESTAVQYYDFRALLERHLPRFIPLQLVDENVIQKYNQMSSLTERSDSTKINGPHESFSRNTYRPPSMISPNNYSKDNRFTNGLGSTSISMDRLNEGRVFFSTSDMNKEISKFRENISEMFEMFLEENIHHFIQTFISDCAFLLTKLKDAEEDSLLSGEDLDLDDIATKADLERFFVSVFYFYSKRPHYVAAFWEDKESAAYGFVEWASKCNDNLMKSCFYLMLGGLSSGKENALNVYYYLGDSNPTSWKRIADTIGSYSSKILNLGKAIQAKEQENEGELNTTLLALEEGLNEETIVFLSSLLTLISSVADQMEPDEKLMFSHLFVDVIFELTKCETPLVGACFNTISTLVPILESDRASIWHKLDSTLFKGVALSDTSQYISAFSSILTTYSDVLGFLALIRNLLQIESFDCNKEFLVFGHLQYPNQLGRPYRKSGIWPYLEFVMNEVFVNSDKITDSFKRHELQERVLEIILTCLNSFDYSVLLNSISVGANLDNLVHGENFASYVQDNAAPAMFNFLFQENVYTKLYSIASVGIDNSSLLKPHSQLQTLLRLSLSVIERTLDYEKTYTEELLTIIKKYQSGEFYRPKYYGLHGLVSFTQTVFFNLDFVTCLGLYIGLDNDSIPIISINILRKLALLFNSTEPDPILGNKLFTLFDSIDESARIKDAFIDQLDCPIENSDNLMLKVEILEFLKDSLDIESSKPSVAHLLLGFQYDNTLTFGPNLSTFIQSGHSLFHSVIRLLISALNELSSYKIDFAPMRLAALSLQLLELMCKSQLTSDLVIEHITNNEIIKKIMDVDPQTSNHTLWNGLNLESTTQSTKVRFIQGSSAGAYLMFLRYRTSMIQFLNVVIHTISLKGTISRVAPYTSYLISNSIYSARIFSLLRPLHQNIILKEKIVPENLQLLKDLPVDLDKVQLRKSCTGNIYDFDEISSVLELHSKTYSVSQLNSKEFMDKILSEFEEVKQLITLFLVRKESFSQQLAILHNWVQLVQIIVSDGNLGERKRSTFILEVFDMVTPKISVYVDIDVKFAEELVSLMVFLFHIYNQSNASSSGKYFLDSKLHNLFQVCIRGISSPLSSLKLRSDFYVIANNYLLRVLKNSGMAYAIVKDLRLNNERLVEVICNDAIYGEGAIKITGLLLLDSLVQLGNHHQENFIVMTLMRSTKLFHIIRSLKATDSLLNASTENVNVENFLYELTAFKATAYFLIRIAETREGAVALIESKVFDILAELNFLKIDPDLGLELVFDETSNNTSSLLRVNITFDEPLILGKEATSVSIFELIIPIFQLMLAIVISSGRFNDAVRLATTSLLKQYQKLIIGTFKRDTLYKSGKKQASDELKYKHHQEFIKLVVLICTITKYEDK
ncbi:Hypothetical protein J6896_03037 [Nakaseomyces glabratus]